MRLFWNQNGAEILAVDRERHAETVHDLAALRGQEPQADAVLVGEGLELLLLDNLQERETPRQRAEGQHLPRPQQQGAPREFLMPFDVPVHGFL